jgi:hypothetical protein
LGEDGVRELSELEAFSEYITLWVKQIAKLQYHYKGSEWPGGWWNCPIKILKVLLLELERLKAEDDLRAIRVAYLASKAETPEEASKKQTIIEQLEKASLTEDEIEMWERQKHQEMMERMAVSEEQKPGIAPTGEW